LPALEKAKRRGVVIRIAAPINEDNIKYAREFAKIAEVRAVHTSLQGRFAIIDSSQLMFMVLDDRTVHPNYDVALWISTEFFSKALEQMFELAWNDFTPLKKVRIK